ncbi:methyl-accepting chemotaxis protein [Vogesella sp. LIG4]|uniref:methyl-accepting chemotaxis protein n=1 Tax=Vogesella sp. LIG4 TaxID=1192162 RepID=UPI00081F9098|nr:HAMP domain-containing methyl-accepting chemotaxis protein [Vogesella sp. LIG4]SCK14176.1 methyl-accepting chemotaxis protein [Vogesella sp. LIG4]
MFKHVYLSTRIVAGFAALVLLLLFVAISGVSVLHQAGNSFQNVVEGRLQFSNGVQSLRADMGNLRRFEKDTFINLADAGKRNDYIAKWGDSLNTARSHLQEADKFADSDSRAQIQTLNQALGNYEQGFKTVTGQIAAGTVGSTLDANKAMGPFKSAIHSMEALTQHLVDSAVAGARTDEQGAMAAIAASTRLLLIVSGVGVLLAVAIAAGIVQSIRQPLQQITQRVEQLAASRDLRDQLPDYGRNEIGRVAQALNTLLTSVRELIGESRQHSERLVHAADQLSGVSQNISGAAANQSQAASACAAAIEQLTVSVTVMADSAQGVEQQVRGAAGAAEQGAELAGTAARQIQHIADNISNTGTAIDSLNQRSGEIGNIVGVIHDIADQTNLLALNAAIEAARAGESGRGFAVVADEVRKLAERTSQATAEIAQRIQGVQADTNAAHRAMQQAGELVAAGVEDTGRVVQALQQIRMSSLDSVHKVAEMAAAVQEQGVASQDIARSMEQIAQMNDRTSLSVRESADLAGGLKQQAGELDVSITRFTV